MEVELKYKILAKKYKLPSYKDINKEFEISSIEECYFLLSEIRKKIMEKVSYFINLLEDIIHPEASISAMYEGKVLDDKTKEKVIKLYKELMIIKRKAEISAIENKEEVTAKFVEESFKKWLEIKPKLLKIVKLLLVSWKKEVNVKEDLFYLG